MCLYIYIYVLILNHIQGIPGVYLLSNEIYHHYLQDLSAPYVSICISWTPWPRKFIERILASVQLSCSNLPSKIFARYQLQRPDRNGASTGSLAASKVAMFDLSCYLKALGLLCNPLELSIPMTTTSKCTKCGKRASISAPWPVWFA